MRKIKFEKVDKYLAKKLEDPRFREGYEFEKAKLELALKLTKIRKKSGKTQAQVARQLHISQQLISQIETGEAENITINTLTKLAATLGKDIRLSFVNHTSKNGHLIVV